VRRHQPGRLRTGNTAGIPAGPERPGHGGDSLRHRAGLWRRR
ncbi:RHS repeat protein, partial [Escherichia coli]